jgi:integrase
MYLVKRHRTLWAMYDVPSSLHKVLGRRRFAASLGTSDQRVAERRAAALKALWLSQIDQARETGTVNNDRDALWWRGVMQEEATEEGREMVRGLIADEARNIVDRAAVKVGILDHRDPQYRELPAHDDAERFQAIATGKLVRLNEHVEAYLALCIAGVKPATIIQRRATIKRFCADAGFTYIADVTKKRVQQWVNSQATSGNSIKTTRRNLSELRGYWHHLQSLELAPDDVMPFDGLKIAGHKGRDRDAFSPADVVKLRRKAQEDGDTKLSTLIELLMYSGCRREEICALKVEHVSLEAQSFDIKQAKTKAGIRTVPLHSAIKDTMKHLCATSKDGYVISELRKERGKPRGEWIGRDFTVLKRKLGFGDTLTLHSIRHTVMTMLEDAGVMPGVSADLLGHAKQGMARTYAKSVSLKTKREAIEKLKYEKFR